MPDTTETRDVRIVRDPFLGVDAQVSNRLTDRLRGKYACGPTLPNGEPEFGWREHQTPPIQHEAAQRIDEQSAEIERLSRELLEAREALTELSAMYTHAWDTVDGGLLMMGESIPRFEAAHERARAALAKASAPGEGV